MRLFRIVALTVLVAIAITAAIARGSTAGQPPPPARVDCGKAGVPGTGFTVYVCGSGAGDTKYAHPSELLVLRANGSYTGYRDAFSQADLVRKMNDGNVIASHNNAIVRVTASALTPLISQRQLGLVPGHPRVGSIDALSVDSSGDIFLRANYYARNRHGCENVRWELAATGHLKLRWRSKTGLTCG